MWLTVWIASYMIARLASALCSQGVPAFCGWARMRLPSVSPMVFTIADDSSRSWSWRVIMLMRSARSLAPCPSLRPAL